MGIAQVFTRVVHEQLVCRAAWPPVANTFALGDYGLMSGGVFVALGNVQRDFGIPLEIGPESPDVKLDFVSHSTTIVRVAAGVDVPAFPPQPVDAKLTFKFEVPESLVLKAREVRTQELKNVERIARLLGRRDGWRLRFRVVRQVWTARNALVLTTRAAETNVTLSGRADILRELDAGNVGAEVSVASDKAIGLELVGRSGIVGLGLFRVRLLGGAELRGPGEFVADREDDRLAELEDDF